VTPERGRVQAAAAKLTREYAGLVEFETVLWEDHFSRPRSKASPTPTVSSSRSSSCCGIGSKRSAEVEPVLELRHQGAQTDCPSLALAEWVC
jgi:hypothetical protein